MPQTPGYNETVLCPFNKSHLILAERMQTHLVKCSKNYPEIKLQKCPFNVTHLVSSLDYESHLLKCEDRASFDLYKYNISPGVKAEHERKEPPPPIVSDTNWDDDEEHPTYDPQAYAAKANVLRTLNVATPSEKKAFREAEKLRLQHLTK